MTTPTRVLLLEDNPDDVRLEVKELKKAEIRYELKRVETAAAFSMALREFQPTLILANHGLTGFDGLSALALAMQECPDIPVILISENLGEELIIESLQNGAADYVLKSGLHRLGPAVRRALRAAAERKELENARQLLETTTAKLNQLLAESPAVIYSFNIDGPKLVPSLISENVTRVLGFTAAETLAPDWWPNNLHPDHAEHALADICTLLAEGRLVREYRMRHKNGTWRWLEDQQRVVCDAQGDPVQVAGVWTDITERMQARENILLRDSALRATADGIMITDTTGRIEWVNPALCAQTGYQEDELLGRNPRILSSGKHDAGYYQKLWRTILAGKVWSGEIVNRRKDGTLYHEESSITPVLNAAGEVTQFIAIKRDVTVQKQARNEIRKLAAFPRCNPNPVLQFSADGQLDYANAATEELAALANCPIPQLLPSDIRELIVQCLGTGRSSRNHEVLVGKHTVSWSFFPITEHQVVHAYGTDISERLLLEEQFRQSQKMEAIGQLSSGVAHDFNNLLAVIMGHAEMAETSELTAEQLLESLQEITAASKRASSLSRQLLTFSRDEPMRKTGLNLNDVTSNMTKMLHRLLGEHISLEFQPGDALPPVLADIGMMEQVLMNLAVNARDAMPSGGKLIVTTRREVIDAEYVRLHREATPGEYVCLNVRDTGTGISKENLERIFEPFFTTKQVGKGTGLGLATVFGIVKQHNGWVRVYSELGEGTVFRVFLPVDAQSISTRGEEEAPVAARDNRGTETILLAEDEEAVRRIARMSLKRAGYEVLEAETGPEALKTWHAHRDKIKLLLTDMIMPGGMNGRELALAIRREDPGIKVVFSSGYSVDSAGNPFETDEDSCFLQKPYASTRLTALVRECLDDEMEAK